MRKIFLLMIVIPIVLLLCPLTVLAEDLPIDIDAIDRIGKEGNRRAVTVQRGIDLFSESADKVNEAFNSHFQSRRETAIYGLFIDEYEREYETAQQRILRIADESALFSEPMQFSRSTNDYVPETTPMWVVAVILLGFVGIVFFIIRSAMVTRKERKSDVYHINN